MTRLSGADILAGRPPSEIGVLLREALYHGGPRTITQLRAEVNLIRKGRGVSPVTRKYIWNLVHEAEKQGLVERAKEVRKAPSQRLKGHPELDRSYQYKLVAKRYSSPKWVRLPEIVARHI